MSKKNLLNETTVRQFMKYANIEGLADNFINETYVTEVGEDEEALDADLDAAPPGLEGPEDLAPPAPEEGLPVGDEPVTPLPPDALNALDAAVEKGVDALFTALEPLGFEGEASTVGDEELPADLPPEDTDMSLDDEEEVVSGVDVLDEDEIVNETMKRVSRRLRAMKAKQTQNAKREALVEDLASRIAKRLKIK